MMKAMRIAAVSLSLCLIQCLAAAAYAGPPDGEYSVDVGGANEVWYPAGDNQLCDTRDGDTICIVTTGAATDGEGSVTSAGELQIHFPGLLDGNMPMTSAGKLSGSTAKPTAKVALDASGLVTFHDVTDIDVQMTAAGKFACANPLPHAAEFNCKARVKLCVLFQGHRTCSAGGLRMLLSAGGSSWLLFMALATDDSGVVTGTATATLANAASEAFTVTGKYNPKNDRSTLRLESTDPLSKNKATFGNLVVGPDIAISGKLAFVIAGEKGTEKILPPP
jgi:hypothetical protein